MREIKFRAWDKTDKESKRRMIYIDDLGNVGMFSNQYYYELMQFTGIKDSKGREIYEGDIIRVPGNLIIYGTHNASVEWSVSDLGWCTSSGLKITNHSPDSIPTLEIIGNVHEHPELLEDNA